MFRVVRVAHNLRALGFGFVSLVVIIRLEFGFGCRSVSFATGFRWGDIKYPSLPVQRAIHIEQPGVVRVISGGVRVRGQRAAVGI